MIDPKNISVTRVDYPDGSVEYRARLLMNSYHRLTPRMLEDIRDLAAVETNVKETLQRQIWQELYGELVPALAELISASEWIADPRYPMTDLQQAIRKMQKLLE